MDRKLCVIFVVVSLVSTILACANSNLKNYGRCRDVNAPCTSHEECCCPNQCVPMNEDNSICRVIPKPTRSALNFNRFSSRTQSRRLPTNYREREQMDYRDYRDEQYYDGDDNDQTDDRYSEEVVPKEDRNSPNNRDQPDDRNQVDNRMQGFQRERELIPPDNELYTVHACVFPNLTLTNQNRIALCTPINNTVPRGMD